jgi:hypothetical protein
VCSFLVYVQVFTWKLFLFIYKTPLNSLEDILLALAVVGISSLSFLLINVHAAGAALAIVVQLHANGSGGGTQQRRNKGGLHIGHVLNVLIEARQEEDVAAKHSHGGIQIAEEILVISHVGGGDELHEIRHLGLENGGLGGLLLLSQLNQGLRPQDNLHSLAGLGRRAALALALGMRVHQIGHASHLNVGPSARLLILLRLLLQLLLLGHGRHRRRHCQHIPLNGRNRSHPQSGSAVNGAKGLPGKRDVIQALLASALGDGCAKRQRAGQLDLAARMARTPSFVSERDPLAALQSRRLGNSRATRHVPLAGGHGSRKSGNGRGRRSRRQDGGKALASVAALAIVILATVASLLNGVLSGHHQLLGGRHLGRRDRFIVQRILSRMLIAITCRTQLGGALAGLSVGRVDSLADLLHSLVALVCDQKEGCYLLWALVGVGSLRAAVSNTGDFSFLRGKVNFSFFLKITFLSWLRQRGFSFRSVVWYVCGCELFF